MDSGAVGVPVLEALRNGYLTVGVEVVVGPIDTGEQGEVVDNLIRKAVRGIHLAVNSVYVDILSWHSLPWDGIDKPGHGVSGLPVRHQKRLEGHGRESLRGILAGWIISWSH